MPHSDKKVIFGIVTIFISVILGFSIIEVISRIIGFSPNVVRHNEFLSGNSWAKEDLELGWVNAYGRFRSTEPGKNVMSFNKDGSRATPFHRSKNSIGELLVVGGSFTQGYGVKDQDTFSFLVDDSQEEFRVKNFGVGGYSTYQSLLTMKRHMKTSTRAVMYGYISPHRNRNVSDISNVMLLVDTSGSHIVSPHARLIENGLLQYHEFKTIRPWPLEGHSAILTLAHNAWMRMIYRTDKSERETVTLKLIADMNEYAVMNDAEFYLVALFTTANDMIPSIAKSKGINVIDCSTSIDDYMHRPELRLGSGLTHPSPLQHEIWASCIMDSALR